MAATPVGSDALAPAFWKRLCAPEISTILIAGCGGGFDFVHGCALIPALIESGKKIVISSFSFGQPAHMLSDDSPIAWPLADWFAKSASPGKGNSFAAPPWQVRIVTAKSDASQIYAPEKHVAAALDRRFPAFSPHKIYACNARAFTPILLKPWYEHLIEMEEIDAVLLVDGGSDSLMKGDEEGLGDPLEDATSVQTVAMLSNERLRARVLVAAGFGADRFNGVSDASSLRAIAELTKAKGFLGTFALTPDFEGTQFYRDVVQEIYRNQSFRSVLTGMLLSASSGQFGWILPEDAEGRAKSDTCFVWPLMVILFGFDIKIVAKRSLTCASIMNCEDVSAMFAVHKKTRQQLQERGKIRPIENLPRHNQTPRDQALS